MLGITIVRRLTERLRVKRISYALNNSRRKDFHLPIVMQTKKFGSLETSQKTFFNLRRLFLLLLLMLMLLRLLH